MGRFGLIRSTVEVLLPSVCVDCARPLGGFDRGLCVDCWSRVIPLQGARCARCAGPADEADELCLSCMTRPPDQAGTVVWGEHSGALRRALLALKYSGRDELAAPLGSRLAARLVQAPWLAGVDDVVAVPSHLLHRLRRGWPAAELLARCVAREVGRPWRRVLARRGLRRQAGRSRTERRALAADRFRVASEVAGRRLLVIDDVLTTGATLRRVAGALLAAGAETVYCAALATAPLARRTT